jgi:hypothetical protein
MEVGSSPLAHMIHIIQNPGMDVTFSRKKMKLDLVNSITNTSIAECGKLLMLFAPLFVIQDSGRL